MHSVILSEAKDPVTFKEKVPLFAGLLCFVIPGACPRACPRLTGMTGMTGNLLSKDYFTITGCVVVIPVPFMRMMYWPFGISARLNT